MPQRSPVTFWLLLAATIAVDAVAVSWLWMVPHPYGSLVAIAVLALVMGQLSVVCIWSTLRHSKSFRTNASPWLAAIVATGFVSIAFTSFARVDWDDFGTMLAYHGLHTAMLLAALWIVQRTPFWQRCSGVATPWRYSMAHLLLVMTVVAILAAITSRTNMLIGDGLAGIVAIAGGVALATLAVVIFSMSIHWLLQLATVLGSAILFGAIYAVSSEPSDRLLPLFMGAYFLVQGIVISSWIAWGQIMPESRANSAAAT